MVHQVRTLLTNRQSVLLFGPEAIGKSAILAAAAKEGIRVVDPFERVSRQVACDMRRALDRGEVFLGASRVSHGRQLGAVGRILWRFSLIRVRELPDRVLQDIVARELGTGTRMADGAWLRDVVTLARGRPGFAGGMGRFARQWRETHGYLPLPAMAFAVIREDDAIRGLRRGTAPYGSRQSKEVGT